MYALKIELKFTYIFTYKMSKYIRITIYIKRQQQNMEPNVTHYFNLEVPT